MACYYTLLQTIKSDFNKLSVYEFGDQDVYRFECSINMPVKIQLLREILKSIPCITGIFTVEERSRILKANALRNELIDCEKKLKKELYKENINNNIMLYRI